MRAQDQQTRVFYELCSMIIHILRFPPLTRPIPSPFSSVGPSASSSRQPTTVTPQVSPAAFASLFIGISLALMLFGSVTFVIGFILMPWVIGLVLVFYLFGIVSNLSELGQTILCPGRRFAKGCAW